MTILIRYNPCCCNKRMLLPTTNSQLLRTIPNYPTTNHNFPTTMLQQEIIITMKNNISIQFSTLQQQQLFCNNNNYFATTTPCCIEVCPSTRVAATCKMPGGRPSCRRADARRPAVARRVATAKVAKSGARS